MKTSILLVVLCIWTIVVGYVNATTPPNYGQAGGTILTAADVTSIAADIVRTFGLTNSYGVACAPCTQGDNVGAMLRLVWRDSVGGGGPKGAGGPNGCVAFNPTEGGLDEVIATYETIWRRWSTRISRADLWVLGAREAVRFASTASGTLSVNGMAATPGPLVLPFQYGRQDLDSCNGLDAQFLTTVSAGMDWSAINSIFVGRYGMTVAETVALLGAHSLGRTQTANSGFNGGWTSVQSSFTNLYYTNLALTWRQTGTQPVWTATQGGAQIIMLGVDVEPLFSDAVGPDGGGCARWTGFNPGGCTRNTLSGAGSPSSFVVQYSNSITAFFAAFSTAFQKMTELQWRTAAAGGLSALAAPGSTVRPISGGTTTPTATTPTSTTRASSTGGTITRLSSTGTSRRSSTGTTQTVTCRRTRRDNRRRCTDSRGRLVTDTGALIFVNGTTVEDDLTDADYLPGEEDASAIDSDAMSSSEDTNNHAGPIAAGVVVGGLVLIGGVVGGCCLYRRHQRNSKQAKLKEVSANIQNQPGPSHPPPSTSFGKTVAHIQSDVRSPTGAGISSGSGNVATSGETAPLSPRSQAVAASGRPKSPKAFNYSSV